MSSLQRSLFTVFFLLNTAWAQHRVPPEVRYHRLICVVPIIGSGKADDAIRPQYAPLTPARTRGEILGYTSQTSDDGKWAIVEFVAVDRAAFSAILADKNPLIRVFERGKDSRAAIEIELRKWKKDIDLDHFGVGAQ